MSSPLWLDRNLILRAGAGTGKTHALTTLGLTLCAGIRRGPPLPAERIWMLTFTEKAAGEMRARLLLRADDLASGKVKEPEELELRAAAEAAGVSLPDRRRWSALRDELVACRATTLHGACAALLRELPMSGLASFETWEEQRSQAALRQSAREAVLAVAESGALLEDLPLDGAGDRAEGLVGLLCAIHRKLAEDGLGAEGLQRPVDPPDDLREAAADWLRCFEVLVAKKPHLREAFLETRRAWPESSSPGLAEAFWKSWDLPQGLYDRYGPKRSNQEKEAAEAHKRLVAAVCVPRVREHWEIFRGLLVDAQRRYALLKKRAHALDFADLCNRARDLLRDDLEARRLAKARVGALLLDESQDTNRVQMELCLLLSEERGREQELPSGAAADEVLELEPAIFCAVGDRKQSIYGFRGADVSVVERLRRAVLRGGGEERFLDVCRRSRPELLDFFHRLFPGVLTSAGADYEVAFDPEADRLAPFRAPLGQPAVELLQLPPSPHGKPQRAETLRLIEAEALADRAVQLLREPPAGVRQEGILAPGHLAVLFRTASNLALFRAAFEARGIPCAVVGGDGFYGCPEIQDAAALLAAAVDPGDGLAVLGLLRSPLCGVYDETIARLSFARRDGGLSLHDLTAFPPGIDEADRLRLERFGASYLAIKGAVAFLGPGRLLAEAELLFDQRARYGTPQAFANLEKLTSMAREWEAQGMSTAEAAFRLQRACEQQTREELAPAVDEEDLSALRMMTVHQAKGLEFPVVMVPECGSSGRESYAAARFARKGGLAIKVRGPDGDWYWPPAFEAVQEEANRREAADQRRLLYVAATRAKDLLIFSGEKVQGAGKFTWRDLIAPVTEGVVLRQAAHLRLVREEPLVSTPRQAVESLQMGLRATESLSAVTPRDLTLPVTASAELALCPRRFQLAQLWHVSEPAWGEGREAGSDSISRSWSEELPSDEGARQLGSLAHALLERVDLVAAGRDPEGALRAAAGMSPRTVPKSVLAEVRAVLASELGKQLAILPEAQVQRERPFVLAIGQRPRLVLHGSIDLMCLLPERALVIDYKRGPPADPDERRAYRAQVEIYALAAHDLTGGHLPLWGGLWFLGEAQRGPRLWRIGPERLAELRRQLERAAAEVAGRSSLEGLWQGREIDHCRATQCPFLARCHGSGG